MNKARLIYLVCSLSTIVYLLMGVARHGMRIMGGDSWHDGG